MYIYLQHHNQHKNFCFLIVPIFIYIITNIPSTFTNSNCFLKALVPSQIQDLYHKATPYLSLSQLQLNNLK